jgi:hypothetical protein
MDRVIVTNGSPARPPLAYFTSEEKAQASASDLSRTRDFDQNAEFLPGAWAVRVNDRCKLTGCDFVLDKSPAHSPNVFKTGRDVMMAVGYGRSSPRDAAASARLCMKNYLNLPPGRHR